MNNTQIAQYLAAQTPQEMADNIDAIFTTALELVPEPLHGDVANELAAKGILISAGQQNYAESICGRKKAPAPH